MKKKKNINYKNLLFLLTYSFFVIFSILSFFLEGNFNNLVFAYNLGPRTEEEQVFQDLLLFFLTFFNCFWYICCFIPSFIISVLVYRNAVNKNIPNATLWAFFSLLFPPIVPIIYYLFYVKDEQN